VSTLLECGVPLHRLKNLRFRRLVSSRGGVLCDPSNLGDHVTFLLKYERDQVLLEIRASSYCSIFFDGTCRVAEVFVLGVRYLRGFRPQQRLLRLQLLSRSLTGEALAANLFAITRDFNVTNIVAFHSDNASVNCAGMRVVSAGYPDSIWIGCMAHTLNNTGSRFKRPILSTFVSGWKLMLHSHKVRSLFSETTGTLHRQVAF